MSSGVTRRLRQAKLSDAEALAEVEMASWLQAYTGILPNAYMERLTRAKCMARWLNRMMAPKPGSERIWVIEIDGALVGYAQSSRCRDRDVGPRTAEITTIYLAPQAWGLGLGRALMDMVVLDLETRGASEVILWVLAANMRARRFYKRNAFVSDGGRKIEHWFGAKLPQLRYRRKLTSRDD